MVTVFVFQEPSLLSSLQDNGLTDVMLHALLIKDVSSFCCSVKNIPCITLSAKHTETQLISSLMARKSYLMSSVCGIEPNCNLIIKICVIPLIIVYLVSPPELLDVFRLTLPSL